MNSPRAAMRILRRVGAPATRRCFGQFTGSGSGAPLRPMGNIPMPYITEVTSGGWRTLCLNGAIDDTTSAAIVAQLLWLESDNPDKPITMYINSPGGEVSSGLAIYDTMTYIKSPVSTVCVGAAASMAAVLLIGGEPGKRYALPHSTVMIQRIREQINKIVQSHINKSFGYEKYDLAAISDMMERDKYLTAEEAVELGVVDQILDRRVKDEAEKKAKDGETPAPQP
ncbi:putative ATP-dependent Clp protease, proteolytic subunit [Sordaria macrospora k-hell]|uniref:ATP-dependent Clp protease proteolytic subunit n=1 Tax=Sordaria macrospora (strain ATCC MYA-333 / DSM 997 / K(L3346) / K-hell) TaxID=771870 RepID=F7VXC8_SORMK|nr:putative ATP-dependent Clp protease, proteolytic subunit [Sordaria macrospora k-hell]CCC10170.1 putative ATP-dependent Clp protease, proteolytic subunit [Sordaria macrospora k-hell]